MTDEELRRWVEECYPALEPLSLLQSERVGFGDDGDDVHLVVDGLHELNVQRLQAAGRDTGFKLRS